MPLERILQQLREVYAKTDSLSNALQSVNSDKLLIDIAEDDVGIAKDATLSDVLTKITDLANALQSVGTDKLLIDIAEDDVGIAKDATLSSLKLSHVQDVSVSLSNTGTAAVWDTVLSTPISISDDGEYSILVLLDTSTEIKLDVTIGTVTHSGLLNDGNALTANAWYEFVVSMHSGDSINFEINVPAGGSVSGIIRIFKRG